MVERTPNPKADEEEGRLSYSYYDKKLICDFCSGEIGDVRVIKSSGIDMRPVGVFCSYKCSIEWGKKNS